MLLQNVDHNFFSQMDGLPREVWAEVARHLASVRNVLSFASTCRELRDLVAAPELDATVWRRHAVSAVGRIPQSRSLASYRAACEAVARYKGPRFPKNKLKLCGTQSEVLLLSNKEADGTSVEFFVEKLVPAAFLGLGVATSAARQILGDAESGGLYNRGFYGFRGELEECELQFAEGDLVRVSLANGRLTFSVNGQAEFCPYYGIPSRKYYFAVHYQADWNHSSEVSLAINVFA